MTDGSSRFTSDRRLRGDASWADSSDWEAGTAENVDVVGGGLVPREGSVDSNVVDNFEVDGGPYADDDALSECYQGDTDRFHRQQSVVNQGEYALELDDSSNEPFLIYTDRQTSPTGVTPSVGDSFEVFFRPDAILQTTSVYYRFLFGVGSSGGGYSIEFNDGGQGTVADQDISLLSDADGTLAQDIGVGFTRQWYRIVVDWEPDGLITATVYDEGGNVVTTLSASDSRYSQNDGFGFSVRSVQAKARHAQWDSIRILE
jgi:hypothetical protein